MFFTRREKDKHVKSFRKSYRSLLSIVFTLLTIILLISACKGRTEYYVLTLTSNLKGGGYVSFDTLRWTDMASQTIIRGIKIPVTAKRASGFSFEGWYYNETCLCTNTTYNISIFGNTTLEAKFEVSPIISFDDATLTNAIRNAEGYTGSQQGTIYQADVMGIETLAITNQIISSLNGLQHLCNLKTLELFNCHISDLSTLSSLSKLESLDIRQNQISDLSPLMNNLSINKLLLSDNIISDLTPISNLANLLMIILDRTAITDLSPLANLGNLTVITVSETGVSSIDPLAGLNNLGFIDFSRTNITNLSALSNLNKLIFLAFSDTKVSSLEPLRNLITLEFLALYQTDVTDLSPLENLEKITTLLVSNNDISSLEPLKKLLNLEYIDFSHTNVYNLSPLTNLINLSTIGCRNNQVTDLSPLANLINLSDIDFYKNRIEDLSPLINNTGIGEDDSLNLIGNSLDITEGSEDMNNIQQLINRGVDLEYLPQNAIPVITKLSGPDSGNPIYVNYALFKWNSVDQIINRSIVDFVVSKDGGEWEDRGEFGLNNYVWYDLANGSHTLSIKVIDDQGYESNILTWEFEYRAPVTITIQASPTDRGDVTFYDTWTDIASQTVTADSMQAIYSRAKNSYVLDGWYENNTLISTSTNLSFTASSDRLFIAQFIPDIEVVFTDATLTTCIRENDNYTGNQSGPIYQRDVSEISRLDISNKNIVSLSGIQHLHALWDLDARNNNITDVTPVASLTNLVWLLLSDNAISDITSLANLKNLSDLHLSDNTITDISSLSSLTKLSRVLLDCNTVDDLTPLVNNIGFSENAILGIVYNNLDLTPGSEHMNSIQTLIDRGVTVYYTPQN